MDSLSAACWMVRFNIGRLATLHVFRFGFVLSVRFSLLQGLAVTLGLLSVSLSHATSSSHLPTICKLLFEEYLAPQQQQQQQQQSFTDAAHIAMERSTKILNAWSTELSALPVSREELKAAVEAELPTPIPTLAYSMPVSDSAETDVLKACRDSGQTLLVADLEKVRCHILQQERLGTSEDTLHPIVENLILAPMNLLAGHVRVALRFDRNSSDSSGATLKRLRPDVLIWLPSGVLAFKGEDKATAAELQVATQELSTKLKAFTDIFFGSLPYQLCYALGGQMLQFCAVLRTSTMGAHELVRLTDTVDLSTIRGRSLCVRYAVNITRILVAMQRSFPFGSVISLGSTMTTTSSAVSILDDHVMKKALKHSGYDTLKQLYDLLEQTRGVEGLIRVYKSPRQGRNHLTLYLEPVGFCGRRPGDVAAVKAAGRRILLALQFLHSRGWVHRDIRPSNVMFADQNWYLVDLEWANTANSELGVFRPLEEWTPPEISGENCQWTCACDMWQFGRLVEAWGSLDEDFRAYIRVQSKVDPSLRLSADESLRHAFFA